MATQPHGHPILSTEHVTSSETTIPLPQSLPLKFPDPATTPSSNSNSLRNVLSAQTHLSPSFNSKLSNSPSPHLSTPGNVVIRDPLSPSSDPSPPPTLIPVNQNLSAVSADVAQILSSRTESPPKRRKIEIVAPELPKSQAVLNAVAVSAPQPSKDDKKASSSALETDERQSLSQLHQQNCQKNSPETGSTKKSLACECPSSSHTASKNMNEASTGIPTNLLKDRTVLGQEKIAKEADASFPNKQDCQNSSSRYVLHASTFFTRPLGIDLNKCETETDCPHHPVTNQSFNSCLTPVDSFHNTILLISRKRGSLLSSVSADNENNLQDSDTREPDAKRPKPDQCEQESLPSSTSIGSPLVNENEPKGRGLEKTDADTTMIDVTNTKPTPSGKSLSVYVTPSPSLPLLRSSPVLIEHEDRPDTRSPESRPDISEGQVQNAMSYEIKDDVEMKMDQDQQIPSVEASCSTRKKKTVSWAAEDKLVDVQFIDNRMELVRSWDADSQVTLPFAPPTLQMFQQALKEQDAAKRNEGHSDGKGAESVSLRSMPKLSSFKEARKREHDMEQERARQAREELKERLNAMTPGASWKIPTAIVLPAECRIDEASVERFGLTETDSYPDSSADPDARSPSSPPHQASEVYDASRHATSNVPVIPLSDRFAQNGDNEFESLPSTDGMDSHDYTASETSQNYLGENHDRSRSNKDNVVDFNARTDSSKKQHFLDSRNGTVGSSGLDLGSDGRNKSRGQYGAVQNDYSDAGPAPSPSQAHAVQHLLSALQSSGLLKQGNGLVNAKSNIADYDRATTSENPHGVPDSSYREGQQGDEHDRRKRDSSDMYESESNENEQPQKDGTVPGQGMSSPDGNIPPPMLGPSMAAAFPPGIQQPGMMDIMHFPGPMGHPPIGIPPMGLPPPGGMPPGAIPPPPPPPPPPPIGIPPPLGMLQMMGVHVPLMSMPPGMQMSEGGQVQSTSNNGGHSGTTSGRSGSGRGVETISRPKPKPLKQRKRCKYFGTKQGCRDGSSCMFAHN